MTSGVAVFDATPLIAFHEIGQLGLLRELFDQVVVPTLVSREVAPSLGVLPRWIVVQRVLSIPTFERSVDAGEIAAIALALQISAEFVILDDLSGRRVADDLGLNVTGSLGLLVSAKQHGLIPEVRPLMTAMTDNGLFTTRALQMRILELAGEIDL